LTVQRTSTRTSSAPAFSAFVRDADALVRDPHAIAERLAGLLAEDGWLAAEDRAPGADTYRQHLLHVYSVPMAPQVRDLLLQLAPDQVDPDARVFPGEKGDAMDGSALHRRYVRALQHAGVRRLRFHDLRHTFGTQAIASGAHVMDVKEWMGHRHLSTTMRYVHHQPRHEAAERLGRHFTGAASELDALLGEPGDFQIGPPRLNPVGTIPDDPNRLRNAVARGHSVVILGLVAKQIITKQVDIQDFRNAGGGTRTPDTRIMISPRLAPQRRLRHLGT